ncbi:MAG: cyclase family protein [Anaerolineae bacterium]|nr:cyclase family protein [Anaerolineae bacterium]
MTYLDLTHPVLAHMPAYPGDPLPEIRCIAEIETDGFTDHQITSGMHIGTHMDAPLHMLAGGARVTELEVAHFFGRGVLLTAKDRALIDVDVLDGVQLQHGDIVLINTGFHHQFWQPAYYANYPELSPALAEALVTAGVSMLGLDTPSPDRAPFAIHKILLRKPVLIIENLTNLDALAATLDGPTGFDIVALPAKFHTDAAPIRVVAVGRAMSRGQSREP